MFDKLKNVKIEFSEANMPFIFNCEGVGIGGFKTEIYLNDNNTNPRIAIMEGDKGKEFYIKINTKELPKEFLLNCYRMAVDNREYKRSRADDYVKGYNHFRKLVVKYYESNRVSLERKLFSIESPQGNDDVERKIIKWSKRLEEAKTNGDQVEIEKATRHLEKWLKERADKG